jgi:hypothetical protein
MPTEKMEKRTDRRKKFRFPIHRELRYKLLDEGVLVGAGTGQSVNVGSGGVAFSIDRELKPGAFVELSISWPVLLDDTCPMRFVVFGRVLRSVGRRSACTIDKYEFRTQARSVQTAPAVRNDSMLLRWADGMRKETMKPRVATVATA